MNSISESTVVVNEIQEAMPRERTIRRNQTREIERIFAGISGGKYHGCASDRRECSELEVQDIYRNDRRAKLKALPGGGYVLDLDYGWIDLTLKTAAVEGVA